MDSRDPPPFGYTFNTTDFFGGEPTAFTNGGPPLLNDTESQSLHDFFSNTDPFLSDAPTFPLYADTKHSLDQLSWDGYVPPATIHGVSTTIPNQAQLHHGYNFDHSFVPEPLSAGHLGNTEDDLQAASTLFNNAHASYSNGRSHSFHAISTPSTEPPTIPPVGLHNMPMVPTSHGLLTEQLAALLPNHTENGSIDEQVAARFASSQAHRRREAAVAELARGRAQLKRSYTYGTDNAFNSSGFVGPVPSPTHDTATQHLLINLHGPQITRQPVLDSDDAKPITTDYAYSSNDDEEHSDEATSDEDDKADDRPTKKRRQTKNPASTTSTKATKPGRKNSIAARPGKHRKTSVDEHLSRKKRLSLAGQKAQRENLSDEQKRSNHILSEQKRRNLIKRGFDDLHDLVPEIRNGGLSKSNVLTEAANFLDKLIEENNRFLKYTEDDDG